MTTIGQPWDIMRRLRAHSPSMLGTIFSVARAAGWYTARRPSLTIRNGSDRSWPMIGSISYVGLAADGVDRAVAGGDRGERRLLRAQPHLVAPVQALLVGPALVDELDVAAHVADARIGERLGQLGQRVRRPHRVGVRERDQLTGRGAHRRVLGADLAAARQLEHLVGAGGSRARRGLVTGAVDGDDHLEAIPRPVERECVRDLVRDHRLLVVCGDDEADERAGDVPAGRDGR